MSLIIREAKLSDAAIIVQLIKEPTFGELSPLTVAYVPRYLACSGSHILLAEEDGQGVGLLCYSLRPDLYHASNVCLIEQFVVKETARGHGVGGALLTDLLHRLSATNCAEVSVTVLPNNEQAIKFYRAHGLVEECLSLEKHF